MSLSKGGKWLREDGWELLDLEFIIYIYILFFTFLGIVSLNFLSRCSIYVDTMTGGESYKENR